MGDSRTDLNVIIWLSHKINDDPFIFVTSGEAYNQLVILTVPERGRVVGWCVKAQGNGKPTTFGELINRYLDHEVSRFEIRSQGNQYQFSFRR
jgi:hypothetical protein